MADDIQYTIKAIEFEGFSVTNWKPDNRRIFKVLTSTGEEASSGMYSSELRAWWGGYLEALTRGKK